MAIGNVTLCGDRRGQGAKTRGFLRFCRCARDPLAGIGVIEVQKLEDPPYLKNKTEGGLRQ